MENSIKYQNPENKVLEINTVAIYIYLYYKPLLLKQPSHGLYKHTPKTSGPTVAVFSK